MSGYSRFDRDPEAVAWARAKVQRRVDKYRGFEAKTRERGEQDKADFWRRLANMLEMELLGGKTCVIAAFDERLPEMAALLGEADAGGGHR